jgi:hypothetical protein
MYLSALIFGRISFWLPFRIFRKTVDHLLNFTSGSDSEEVINPLWLNSHLLNNSTGE